MALYQVIYLSMVSGEAPTRAELQSLLEESVRHNEAAGITGLLLYAHGGFMQLVEGKEAAVKALYARIREDERHCRITKLLEGPIEERSFPEWAMACVFPDDDGSDLPPELLRYLHPGFDAERLRARPGLALQLLSHYSHNNGLVAA
ncbi:BLUF domain-containing protein [Azohydromonas caseinilytica]|uniref:BLUF domain-containing protein n=1 Tax=Azohydromonas caseinilytica TaxID=2728836 RepID=A0A848FHE8_9BURK|nr:BLUF domain-containing protein [Azohydromonas caseinilytica]NML17683.1 BLUF domain-containing protein [Azohydromonas caseinilytica]